MILSGLNRWWQPLRVQQKVWAVLFVVFLPLCLAFGVHLYLVNQLLNSQHDHHETLLAREQLHIARRLTVDIEDAFRGYVLTKQDRFLIPMSDAEAKLERLREHIDTLQNHGIKASGELKAVLQRIEQLLRSELLLIEQMKSGREAMTLAYLRSGQWLVLSDALRGDLRVIEDRLDAELSRYQGRAEGLSQWTFIGLWFAVAGVVLLGAVSSRLLARSITEPIARLRTATMNSGPLIDLAPIQKLLRATNSPGDELSLLAKSYHEMAVRISQHIRELETLEAISRDINTIGPDGVEGVLRRITDRSVELAQADACLVLLRNERMGCWVVEAASGEWNDRLRHSVMLWEEFPVSVQAYQTCQPAMGEHLRSDDRPQVLRRNLIGDSMLAVPLLAQGQPFGVLAVLSDDHRKKGDWNERLIVGMAQQAAVALVNARLYESAQQKQQDLVGRLRHLEHLAEALAHDLKGPSERVGNLARILLDEYQAHLDTRAVKWVSLLEQNSREMVERVEGILAVARVGATSTAVTAVDPGLVIDDVVKAQAAEIARLNATISAEPGLPLVACHGAYLRQIFDNLISNALKYARSGEPPQVTIAAQIERPMVRFSVQDRGIGIPTGQRARVFEPFVRLRQASAPGSGIGLTIVSRIVELWGGQVWIEGTGDQGTTVNFTLPCFGHDPAPAKIVPNESEEGLRPHPSATEGEGGT